MAIATYDFLCCRCISCSFRIGRPTFTSIPCRFHGSHGGHLLLGMLAPLLIALSAPMTLLLRTLNVNYARKLSRLLRSHPIRFFSHPIVASILNIGGLWLLYTTNLYTAMHGNLLLHIIVHIHVFIAGYLFTISITLYRPRFSPFQFSLQNYHIHSSSCRTRYPFKVPLRVSTGRRSSRTGKDWCDADVLRRRCGRFDTNLHPIQALVSICSTTQGYCRKDRGNNLNVF